MHVLYMFMSMFDPVFEPGAALFIIWRRPKWGGMQTLAAGSHKAMVGAWEALQEDYPDDELTMQHRARILRRREPLPR